MVIWKDFGIAFFADIAVFYYLINLYHVTDLFQPPLNTFQNLWFSNYFSGYRKRPVAWNGLRQTAAAKKSHWNYKILRKIRLKKLKNKYYKDISIHKKLLIWNKEGMNDADASKNKRAGQVIQMCFNAFQVEA